MLKMQETPLPRNSIIFLILGNLHCSDWHTSFIEKRNILIYLKSKYKNCSALLDVLKTIWSKT